MVNKLPIWIATVVAGGLHAQAASPFTLSFSTTDYGSNPNIVVGYITTTRGSYVDTIGLYSGNKEISKLTSWRSASGITSKSGVDADAYMGATRSTFYVPNPVIFTWDLMDASGNPVPDATYNVNLEIAVESGGRKFASFSFVKNDQPGTRTVGNNNVFTSISIAYDPPVVNADVDGDGMDDAWESAHGLNPTVNDAAGDLDGDGSSNYSEYVAGTEPNNASSVLAFGKSPLMNGGSDLILNWSSVSGMVYSVQSSSNLLDTNRWANLITGINATPPTNSYTVTLPGGTNGSYRIIVGP